MSQQERWHLFYQSALVFVLFVERWLGRTEKLKAASTLDLAYNFMHGVWEFVTRRKSGAEGGTSVIVSESVSVSKPVRDLGKVLVDAIKKAKSGEAPGQIAQEELAPLFPLLSQLSSLPDDQKADPAAVRRAGLLFVEDLVEVLTAPGK